MEYFYLLTAGILVSSVHFYLVWRNRKHIRYSISENAIIDRRGRYLYFFTHVITEILFLLYSYQFFIVEHNLAIAFFLNLVFAVLDFVQALLPSRGETEKIHITTAYISWVCFLISGIIALAKLHITEPYKMIAILLLVPILGLFFYMNINRSKLYPYQLLLVPLYVVYMLMITIGAS